MICRNKLQQIFHCSKIKKYVIFLVRTIYNYFSLSENSFTASYCITEVVSLMFGLKSSYSVKVTFSQVNRIQKCTIDAGVP